MMNLKDRIKLNLEVHGEIEFIYHNKNYYIGWNREKDGYAIFKGPGKELAVSHSEDWLDALDQPIFNGQSMNNVFDQLEFQAFTV
ncbi:hypothetical protein JZO81_19350 [Enterococcus hulanensis]|uniref:hypothetical protein n=2 Tax=Enterococcus TaxID=1350 RepID=UPI00113173FE|nr:hypothetical protein [Enterococcus sp. 3H8_DIV0648]MBO0413217.1 hypothetical protein [Enterococcus hulanensis]